MNRTMRNIALAFAVLIAIPLSGCGLPTDAKKQAEALPQAVSDVRKQIGERKSALEGQLAQAPEFKSYAEREKWFDAFNAAEQELLRAEAVISKEIKPVVDANKNAESQKLYGLIKKADTLVGSARQGARSSEARLAFLKEAKTNASSWIKEAAQQHAATATDHEALRTLVAKYQGAYPARSDDITKRAHAEDAAFRISRDAAEKVAAEAAKLSAGGADYAYLGDGFTAVKKARTDMQAARPTIEKDLTSLDKSYSKTLVDMKAEYKVCLSRVSWQESEFIEWPTETTYDYPCKSVSEDAHEAAEEFDDRDYEFAQFWWSGWSGKTTKLYTTGDVTEADVKLLWQELGVDPAADWPRSDNQATFHIRQTEARFYHKYSIVENGVKRDGEWEEVKEEFYDEHYDHLGMSLVAKAHGQFEDETVKSASPAGIALVGDDKAGRWEQRGNNTYWVWWPHYHALYGGYYGPGWGGYTRSDWESWRSDRQNGRTYTGNGTYGSAGSATRSGTFASSEFAKRGGFKEASAQVRGAGPANRSGGPQRGGK